MDGFFKEMLIGMMKPQPPKDVGDGWAELWMPPLPQYSNARMYQKGPVNEYLNLMLERRIGRDDPAIFPTGRWHLSISVNADNGKEKSFPRLPTWDELKEARYKFLPPDVNMAIMFPPKDVYYNLHPTCLHLLEIPVGLALDPSKSGGHI